MNIYEKLVDIQGRLKAPKNQRNNFGKYNYRNAEDILEAVKPLLVEHKVTIELDEEIIEILGVAYVQYTTYLTDGKNETKPRKAHAAIDLNRKGMDAAQATGSSSSYAKKYALGALFLLDDTKDPDATNTHGRQVANKTSKVPKPSEKLEELKANTANFDKVKNALKQGFTMADIRQKYEVSEEVERLLLS